MWPPRGIPAPGFLEGAVENMDIRCKWEGAAKALLLPRQNKRGAQGASFERFDINRSKRTASGWPVYHCQWGVIGMEVVACSSGADRRTSPPCSAAWPAALAGRRGGFRGARSATAVLLLFTWCMEMRSTRPSQARRGTNRPTRWASRWREGWERMVVVAAARRMRTSSAFLFRTPQCDSPPCVHCRISPPPPGPARGRAGRRGVCRAGRRPVCRKERGASAARHAGESADDLKRGRRDTADGHRGGAIEGVEDRWCAPQPGGGGGEAPPRFK